MLYGEYSSMNLYNMHKIHAIMVFALRPALFRQPANAPPPKGMDVSMFSVCLFACLFACLFVLKHVWSGAHRGFH